jgi:hypothetical protein
MSHRRAGAPGEAPPVKYLAALLSSEGFDIDARLLPDLEELLGPVDYRGAAHPFTTTDYYEDEMGPGLLRTVVSFSTLAPATELIRVKHATALLEGRFAERGGRRVNIDPGYLDYFKVVLASFKEGPQKIYIGEGVYADPVLLYQDGSFVILPWTFPDLREGVYMDDFEKIRGLYRRNRRSANLD